ncbi:uncharacterized protein [Dendropsophus ebraccatus]|uniref:uncharacterized protein n=1 Tax=Dendropsophus ebraccatus TaxID=150705 RepID=UPI00383144AE
MILLQTTLLLLLYQRGRGYRGIPHVTALDRSRHGVLESPHTIQQSERFPVKISLVSFPDKKTTFSSALLPLTPENHFQGAVNLTMVLEDSAAEFVYLLLESKVFSKEMKMRASGGARPPRSWRDHKRRRERSLLSRHEVNTMMSTYKRPHVQQCCLNGSDHYGRQMECNLGEVLRRAGERCRKAAERCCLYTEEHMYKNLPMAVQQQPQTAIIEPEPSQDGSITITVTQVTSSGSRTFTVRTDPTQDISIHMSSKMADTKVHMWFGRPIPAAEDPGEEEDR